MFLGKESISHAGSSQDPTAAYQRAVVPSDGSSHPSASPWRLPAKKNKNAKVLKKTFPRGMELEDWLLPTHHGSPCFCWGRSPVWLGGVPTASSPRSLSSIFDELNFFVSAKLI